MSPMFRKIAATTLLALASLGAAAPAVGATTTDTVTHAKSYTLTGPNGCIGTVDMAAPHHNDLPVLAVVHGAPMHVDALARL